MMLGPLMLSLEPSSMPGAGSRRGTTNGRSLPTVPPFINAGALTAITGEASVTP